MVTDNSTSKCNRGQLVLIGAISIAFILLGVVVVFNSVQYTETVNNGGANDDLQDIQMVESELQVGVETLDDNGYDIGNSILEEYVEEVYQPAQSRQGPVHISYIDNSWDDSEESFKIRYSTGGTTVTRTIEVDL